MSNFLLQRNGSQILGTTDIPWFAGSQPSGVYAYRSTGGAKEIACSSTRINKNCGYILNDGLQPQAFQVDVAFPTAQRPGPA